MILTCPNCGTQYVVKDGAVPPEGRQVRCAACKHSWHQDPEEMAAVDEVAQNQPAMASAVSADAAEAEERPEELPQSAQAPDYDEIGEVPEEPEPEDESLAEATLIDPRSGPEAEQRAFEEAAVASEVTAAAPSSDPTAEEPEAGGWQRPGPDDSQSQEMFSPFADGGDQEVRERSPAMAAMLVLGLIVLAAALFWFLAPDALKAKMGIGAAGSSPLSLVTTHMDRHKLASGNELLTVTGRVINPTGKEQDVPPLQAQLKSKAGKIVYSWTIQPPAHSLAAGASASFNSAEVNVPAGGDELTITLGEPRA